MSTTKRKAMYKLAMMETGMLQAPRFHFAGLKCLRPTVWRATMGMR